MRRNRVWFWILSVSVGAAMQFFSATPGRASDEPMVGDHIFSIGGRGTYIQPKDADKGDWFGGAQGRLHVLPALAVEGSVDYHRQEVNPDTTIKSYPVQVSLLAYLCPQYRISPFLLGGGGWYYTQVNGPLGYSKNSNRFGVHAGGGLELKLNDNISIDATYRYLWLEKVTTRDINALDKDYEDSGSMVTIGLNFHFGATSID